MPRQKKLVEAWFTRPQLINLFAVPLITVVIGLSGFYFLTKDQLTRHEIELSTIKTNASVAVRDERDEREKTRKAFMDNQLLVAQVLSKIDTRLSVAETKQDVANQTLNKLVDELSRLGRK